MDESMLTLSLLPERDEPYDVLALGAHPDDIELGCGATLMRLMHDRPGTRVHWVVFTGDEQRAGEARASAEALVAAPSTLDLTLLAHRDGFLPWHGEAVKEAFERISAVVRPDLIFTHRLEDAHQDHRLLAELTWQTFRSSLICEYEIVKYEGDLGHPNLFVAVSAELADQKSAHLERYFGSQRDRQWFNPGTFRSLLQLRGVEASSPTGLAEAFTCRKLLA